MDSSKENTTMDTITCSLTSDNLAEIRENFKLSASLKLELPSEDQTIKTPPLGLCWHLPSISKSWTSIPRFRFFENRS